MTARRHATGPRTVVLDSEAVDVLRDPNHTKHRGVLSHLEAAAVRRARGWTVALVVPTTVRVEAAWDRTAPQAAGINRFRARDDELDSQRADIAARLRGRHGVSVADAHLGAAARARAEDNDVIVLTSDPDDVRRVVDPAKVTVVAI